MKTNKTEALALIKSRDLRYYGVYTHDLRDSLAMVDQIDATEDNNEALEMVFTMSLDAMNEQDAGGLLHNLRRCPPRKQAEGDMSLRPRRGETAADVVARVVSAASAS